MLAGFNGDLHLVLKGEIVGPFYLPPTPTDAIGGTVTLQAPNTCGFDHWHLTPSWDPEARLVLAIFDYQSECSLDAGNGYTLMFNIESFVNWGNRYLFGG